VGGKGGRCSSSLAKVKNNSKAEKQIGVFDGKGKNVYKCGFQEKEKGHLLRRTLLNIPNLERGDPVRQGRKTRGREHHGNVK